MLIKWDFWNKFKKHCQGIKGREMWHSGSAVEGALGRKREETLLWRSMGLEVMNVSG